MGTLCVHNSFLGWCCFLYMASFVASAAQTGEDKAKAFPKGSEKAVAAVGEAMPKAQMDEAAEPKGFGGSGGKGTPLFWTVRFHAGKKKQELSVTPEGVIIRLPVPVEVKDMPKLVADAVAKAAPGETVKSAEKNEMRATLKYVALAKARVQRYAIDVSKEGKTTRFTVSPDGKSARATGIRAEKARVFEIRASLRFGALEKPKVYYTVQVEKDGKARTLRFKPGGDLIKKFEFPKKK